MHRRSFIQSLAAASSVYALPWLATATGYVKDTFQNRPPMAIGIGEAGMQYLVAMLERNGHRGGSTLLVACQTHCGAETTCTTLARLGVKTLEFPWNGDAIEVSLASYLDFFKSAIGEYVNGYDAVEVFASPSEMEGNELGRMICESVRQVRYFALPHPSATK
jgi:hypothetical protein